MNTIESLSDTSSISWNVSDQICLCGKELICVHCSEEAVHVHTDVEVSDPLIRNELPSVTLSDVSFMEDKLIATGIDGTTYQIPLSMVPIRAYTSCSREDNDWFPLVKDLGFSASTVDTIAHAKRDQKALTYGTCSGQKLSHRKVIIDNDLVFSAPETYTIVALDIETFNDQAWNRVPQKDDSKSHIGIICLTVRKGDSIVKHAFIPNCSQHVNVSEITLHRCLTEQQMCLEVLSFIAAIEGIVIILTFNGSSSLFNDNLGYDIPWILQRGQTRLRAKKQVLRLDDEFNVKSCLISSIGLPGVFFLDLAQKLPACTSQDQKNTMSSASLDAYLAAYELPSKLDHDYVDLQRRLSQKHSDISDLVQYCQHDATILLSLLDTSAILSKALALMTLMRIPLSYALYHTDANSLELWLQRAYTREGYAVAYYEQPNEDEEGYKGAYCETIAQPGQVYSNIISPDFASLYPTVMRARNIDLLTVNSQDSDAFIVDTSDDEILGVESVSFGRGHSIVPLLLTTMFNRRREVKAIMKAYDKKSGEYITAYTLQLGIKVVLNTLYGLLGNKRSPLFYKKIAASVTAFARQSTLTARKVIEEQGHIFLAADTDSVIVSLSPETLNYSMVMDQMKLINAEVQRRMDTDLLIMEIGEVVAKAVFMAGRKSYAMLLHEESSFINWTRDMEVTEKNTTLKIRGISWTAQEQKQRDHTNHHLRTFLCSERISGSDYHAMVLGQTESVIDEAISRYDIDTLAVYSERVKLSSEKSALAAHLKSSFASVIGESTYVSVLLLQGKSSKTQRKIPVQCIGKNLVRSLDRNAIISTAMAPLTKMLLSKEQKKSMASQFKASMDENLDTIRSDQLLVRLEKLSIHGTTRYSTEIMNRCDVAARLSKIGSSVSVHEMISGSRCRLFFDVDCDRGTSIDLLLPQLDAVVQSELGFLPMRRSLRSSGNKVSAHVFYDVCVSVSYAKHIAEQVKKVIPSVDSQVYRQDGSLRLMNTIKITDNKVIDRRFMCGYDQVKHHFISYDETLIFVSQPLHTISVPIIDHFYHGQSQIMTQDMQVVKSYMAGKKISCDLIKNGSGISIRTKGQYLCPCHGKIHDSDNMWAVVKTKTILIGCHRLQASENLMKISLQRENVQESSRIQDLINQCQQSCNLMAGSILQNNRYLSLDISEAFQSGNVVAIRSQLGTGKSEALSRLLETYDGPCLIVSHRHSFTSDIQKRYGAVAYRDLKGTISLTEHKRVICQIESLSRIRGVNNCLLVLDEIESLLSQLTGAVSHSQDAHSHLTSIIQCASKVILMDGFLQQRSVEMIETLRKEAVICHQNTSAPYADHRISLKKYSPKQQAAVLDEILTSLQRGERVASMVTSNVLATQIAAHATEGGFSVALYTGSDLQECDDGRTMFEAKQEDLSDVATTWKKDLLIYTSSITSGVNFNEEWFTRFVHVYAANTCDPLAFVQGIGRVRKFSSKDHSIWYQDIMTPIPKSPFEMVYEQDAILYHRDLGQQLLLWSRSRAAAHEHNRGSIVVSSLKELGYTIIEGNLIGLPQGILEKDEDLFLTVPVTDDDVAAYQLLRNDRSSIPDCGLTHQQAKKIAVLQSIGFTPTMDINDYQHKLIIKQLSNLKLWKHIQRISGSHENLSSILDSDHQARLEGIQTKLDRTRIHTLVMNIEEYKEFKYLFDMKTFTTHDLPEKLSSNSQCLAILRRAAAVIGYTVDRVKLTTHLKKTIHTYTMYPLIVNEAE